MTRKAIQLSLIEQDPEKVPEDLQRLQYEAVQAIWKTSQDIAREELKKIEHRYKEFEVEVLAQRQEALEKAEQSHEQFQHAQTKIENLTKGNQSLEVDINQQKGELKSASDRITHLQDQSVAQEHEIKRLTEDLGRAKEQGDMLTKRVHELDYQMEQDRKTLKEVNEETVATRRVKERVEKNLQASLLEMEQLRKQVTQEQTRANVSEGLAQELRETVRKLENDVKFLKEEKHELREDMETEIKSKIDLEKQVSALNARLESQEWSYKEMVTKLEKDLEHAKFVNYCTW